MIVAVHDMEWIPSPDDYNIEFSLEWWPQVTIWNHSYRFTEVGTADHMFMRALGEFLA